MSDPTLVDSIVGALQASRAAKAAADAAAAQAAADAEAAKVAAEAQPEAKGRALTFKAVAEDQGVIIGLASFDGNVDLDDEILKAGESVTMAYEFCADTARVFKANHDTDLAADLVCSWPGAPVLKSGRIIAAGESLPDDDPVVAINIEKGKECAWFVGVRPHDAAILETAKGGGVAGFSWAGYVKKTEA